MANTYCRDLALEIAQQIAEIVERAKGEQAYVHFEEHSDMKTVTVMCDCRITYATDKSWKAVADKLKCALFALKIIY